MTTISGLDGDFRHERRLQLEIKYKIMQRDIDGYFSSYRAKNCTIKDQKLQS
jgi:hypothetical protein